MMASEPSRDRKVRRKQALRYLAATILVGCALAATHVKGHTPFFSKGTSDESAPARGRRFPGGALMICGGGKIPDSLRDRFVELAGGSSARIVVIPSGHMQADGPVGELTLAPWRSRKLGSLRLLHAHSRVEANDPSFLRPLAEATGVWISGGSQTRLVDTYLGTGFERALSDLLGRGGVIGGSSAGAAVMTRVMISGGRAEAKLAQGFDLLQGAVVDQHFLKRNRLKRLLGVVRDRPDLIGLGIDEQTAVVVDVRHQRLSVEGNSYVVACVAEGKGPEATQEPEKAEPISSRAAMAATILTATTTVGTPEHAQPGTRMEILKPGDEADLSALKAHLTNAVMPAIDFDAL